MIRKLIRQMLTAQVFSALTVTLCLLIDNIMIGRYLGVTGLAAYSIANPILLVIGAVATMLAAGVQVVCSRSLGRGDQEETNAGYSSAIAMAAGVSLAFMAAVLLFSPFLASILGAGSEGELFTETRDYMIGFTVGAPASMGALVLVPFLQMAGQSGLLIVAVLTMTVADVALDLLNVLVFHGGMLGMGLASSISYYLAMLVSCFYFLSRKCVFRFSFRRVSWKKIVDLLRSGIPSLFNMASAVIMVVAMNWLLKSVSGSEAVAAFSVVNSLGNSACCINTGIGGVSLTLTGIFFIEEDRTSLKEMIGLLCRYAVLLGLVMGVLLLIAAPWLVALFIPEPGEAQTMAVLGLRLYAAGLIPCCIVNALKNAYQATGRVTLTECISLIECAFLPSLCAWLFSLLLGTNGAWSYFVMGEALAFAGILFMVYKKTGRAPWRDDAVLLLKSDFGVTPDNLMETSLSTLSEVTAAAVEAEQFCLRHGQSARVSSHIALCIEEMASNIIQYGFVADARKHHLSVRLLRKQDHWVLRFRDDCGAFDPVQYVPSDSEDGLGIRLVLAMAQEAAYTYSLNLNNLTLKLPTEA